MSTFLPAHPVHFLMGGWLLVTAGLLSLTAAAQQQQTTEWAKLPQMELVQQFAAPLQDTIIQRWRDPVDGIICYIYLPIRVAYSPLIAGYVQNGSNTIGSMSYVTADTVQRRAYVSPGRRDHGKEVTCSIKDGSLQR